MRMENNLCKEEEVALKGLIQMTKETIEVKKADKSNIFIVMDKEEYRRKLVLEQHLETNTYEKAGKDSNKKVFKELENLTEKYSSQLTKSEKKVILNREWKTSYFYVLPKIHKCTEIIEEIEKQNSEYIHMPMPESLKSRPINGGPKSVTQGASKVLEKILKPLVPKLRTFIKDEWDFVGKFPQNIDFEANLITCDIVSLYTSIPLELGIKALDYWIDKLSGFIPSRFTKEFILKLVEFILTNNYFDFDTNMFHQLIGTAMGGTFAPPYACLVVGFLEETVLFPRLLPAVCTFDTCKLIEENFYRFMDDGTTLLIKDIPTDVFLKLLNSMHPAIKFTIGTPKIIYEDGEHLQMITFLGIKIYLSNEGKIFTDVYYKETNNHDYLDFNSHHPPHVKENIPFCLAKRIIVFTTKDNKLQKNLEDLKGYLLACNYPRELVNTKIRNAQLQGPAPKPKTESIIPLISTYYSNYNNSIVKDVADNLLKNSTNERIKNAFKDVKFINSLRQPPNLLRQLCHSSFIHTSSEHKLNGIFKCINKRCKICLLYLQECNSFKTANNSLWEIRCHINCHSLNVVYYLVCNFCKNVSYTGKTDNLRERTNNHISGCRKGTSSDKFDNHVHSCGNMLSTPLKEPFFLLYVFLKINDYTKLRNYEKLFHSRGYDTMNK